MARRESEAAPTEESRTRGEDGSVRWKENEALTPPSLSADYFIEHGNDGRGIE